MMKTIISTALTVSITFTACVAMAAPVRRSSLLPARCLPHPQGAYEVGGQKCYYHYGYQFTDIPPFLRIVQAGSGIALKGTPQPGDYKIFISKNGERLPSLDYNIRFIPL